METPPFIHCVRAVTWSILGECEIKTTASTLNLHLLQPRYISYESRLYNILSVKIMLSWPHVAHTHQLMHTHSLKAHCLDWMHT